MNKEQLVNFLKILDKNPYVYIPPQFRRELLKVEQEMTKRNLGGNTLVTPWVMKNWGIRA